MCPPGPWLTPGAEDLMDAFFNNVFVSSGVWTCEARVSRGFSGLFVWESEKEGGGREEDNQYPTNKTNLSRGY